MVKRDTCKNKEFGPLASKDGITGNTEQVIKGRNLMDSFMAYAPSISICTLKNHFLRNFHLLKKTTSAVVIIVNIYNVLGLLV